MEEDRDFEREQEFVAPGHEEAEEEGVEVHDEDAE